ncbi:hypothetical protein ASE68_13610 [Agromyces sp. Leaf222]|nr:hypothetical protein ASE68_13610 [Agromyces sp. Leaf222]
MRIGDPFDPATAEVGSYVRGRECADPEYLRFASDEAGSMAVVLDDGMTTIESIWVSVERGETTGPATESGVRPGSDLATLLAAHPDATLSRELPNGGTYAVASGPTFLTFAVDDGIVRAMAAATSPSPFREYCA